VLDLMLPNFDGLTVLSTLRRSNNGSCVLILSAKDQTEDRIRGLDVGADDYLIKPFSFDELLSRIRALFRRRADASSPNIEIDALRIDTVAREAHCNGRTLPWTPSEFVLLEYLARYRGRVFSHQQLIDQLYEAAADISKNAVEAHISSIRKKLKDAGAPSVIKTRRGFGYLIE
jgi:DNA-binding response OmpR family regulator